MKNHSQATKRAGLCLALSAGVALVGARGTVFASQGDTPASGAIETARTGIDTWVALRGQIGKEQAQLAQETAFLRDRIELLRGQVADTKAETESRLGKVTESQTKREELQAESAKLKEASDTLQAIIGPLEERTKRLLGRMPAPLVELVQPLAQNIPDDPHSTDATNVSLSRRFSQVVGVLNAIDKYNTDVHVTTETREIMAGTTAQVTALYLGVSTAYYVNASGDMAGRGFVGESGFEWTPTNEAAAEIQQAVKVLNGELPQFVLVPIAVD